MRIEGVLFWVFPQRGECEFREKNIMGKSCTTFAIVKIVRNLSRGRSPCQRVNHVKSGVIYLFTYPVLFIRGTGASQVVSELDYLSLSMLYGCGS